MAEVLFFLAAIGVVGGAIGVVVLRNPFYTVLALVVHLLSLAALFLTLNAEFIAAAQVVVYAGAVMVLYVFVVAYVGGGEAAVGSGQASELRVLAVLFAGALFVCLCIATLGSGLQAIGTQGAEVGPGYGTPQQIGDLLLNRFLLPFELASYLLLLAAVGAVVLASRRRGVGEGAEEPGISVAQLLRPRGTGTMAEAVSGLPAAQATGDRDEREAREGGEERDANDAEDRPRVPPGSPERDGS
ncbi:MAG: NADH-quinone oxidoreductase subunit J [Solirubrobacteraceae bacterium MAG38_C4-C5]|nr:NADH-quinone oxidoreductase subunit J [Candidatus Siliceabacter maunaloa]